MSSQFFYSTLFNKQFDIFQLFDNPSTYVALTIQPSRRNCFYFTEYFPKMLALLFGGNEALWHQTRLDAYYYITNPLFDFYPSQLSWKQASTAAPSLDLLHREYIFSHLILSFSNLHFFIIAKIEVSVCSSGGTPCMKFPSPGILVLLIYCQHFPLPFLYIFPFYCVFL